MNITNAHTKINWSHLDTDDKKGLFVLTWKKKLDNGLRCNQQVVIIIIYEHYAPSRSNSSLYINYYY